MTPEPCGCKVVYDNPPTAEPWRRPIERIIYCPTHDAAPELLAALEPEALARRFHEAYERLAPHYNYETRKESAVPWDDVPLNNRALMVAVCEDIFRKNRSVLIVNAEETA